MIETFMVDNERAGLVHASVDHIRALLALIFPLMTVMIIFYTLFKKDYSVLDYPNLIINGELGWLSQLAMWGAFVVWVARYTRPAWKVIGKSTLIYENGGRVLLGGGQQVNLRNVIEIKSRNSMFNKDVEFLETNGNVVRQSIMFSSVPAPLLISRLRERISGATAERN